MIQILSVFNLITVTLILIQKLPDVFFCRLKHNPMWTLPGLMEKDMKQQISRNNL